MGLIVDTNVFVTFERRGAALALPVREPTDGVFISAVTVSEPLMGVRRADSQMRRLRRAAFVEAIIAAIPALSFDAAVARVHAEIGAELSSKGRLIGAHDLIIAATARHYGFALLTDNTAEFSRVSGLQVVEFSA